MGNGPSNAALIRDSRSYSRSSKKLTLLLFSLHRNSWSDALWEMLDVKPLFPFVSTSLCNVCSSKNVTLHQFVFVWLGLLTWTKVSEACNFSDVCLGCFLTF